MLFFDYIDMLKQSYRDDVIVRSNGTILLGIDKIPKCRHMLFKPLTDEIITSFLTSEYKGTFPKEYIDFLKYSNGANLYTVKLKTEKFEFAHSMFVIFGLPRTKPFGRPSDMEEPFDVRLEDLGRHKKIPNTWLKCGTYIKNYDFAIQNDIFIDTETNRVYSCEKNQNEIADEWDDLDSCFCSIFNSLSNSKSEYNIEL